MIANIKHLSFYILFISSVLFAIINNNGIYISIIIISLILPLAVCLLGHMYQKNSNIAIFAIGFTLILSKLGLTIYGIIVDHNDIIKGDALVLLSWMLIACIYLYLLRLKLKR